jgi:hypothetical protein
MPQKNLLKLHEAMAVAVLNHPKRTLSFEAIVGFIEKKGSFPIRKDNITLAEQIRLRVFLSSGKYAHLFERVDHTTIRLHNV